MHNKERLDGLSKSYFTPMTQEKLERAFHYLSKRIEGGGTEEACTAFSAPIIIALLNQLIA